MAENNLRNLYEIYLELGHDVFEEKIKKPMEHYLHDSTNDIGIHSLNMVIANAMENLKLGEVGNDSIEITSFDKIKDKSSTEVSNSSLTQKKQMITAVPNISPKLFMKIHAILISLMTILYLCIILKCMVMRVFA